MQISDTIYVQRVQAGDDDAFSELLRRHQRPILNFAQRLLGHTAEAEDAAQETFVRAYRHIADFLINQAGLTRKSAATGAVTLIQWFGGAINLDKHT